MTTLRAEIHALRALLPATWIPGTPMPLNAQTYLARHPWLQDVPVWVYDPAGYVAPCARCNATGTFDANCGRCSATGVYTCGKCDGTGRFGRGGSCHPCGGGGTLRCGTCRGAGTRPVECNRCDGTGSLPLERSGKMIGVLIARDQAGLTYQLRGVSGSFPGNDGRPDHGPNYGAPNVYWSRKLSQHWVIPSASRGSRTYNAYNGDDTSFGRCAATHILSHALHLGLEIVSMAEIWIGATMNNRQDGQLQASCDHCRVYFEHMLCDAGGGARTNPYVNAPALPNRGLLVTIREQPTAFASAAPAQIQLHAVGSPGTGTFLWTIQNTAIANYVGGVRTAATLDVDSVAPGTTTVDVQYTLGGMVRTASLTLHVLSVAIQEASPLALPLSAPAGQVIHAAGAPVAGQYQWRIVNTGVARFSGGADPGNVAAATIEPVGAGSTRVEVTFSSGGASARAALTVNVT
ncbi:Hypothetical protein A7982_06381 [Minicystis rosea]|nr:Hypothetical protein A7982_06381 [Minicystis rosea]